MLVPFSLRLTSPVRLLLLSLADDESCTDLEVQWVDDPDRGGQGAVLLAVRRDGTADVHVDRRLTLPRADYEVGAGTHRFGPAAMDLCRFEVTAAGVQVDLGLTRHDGRDLHLVVHEARTSPPPGPSSGVGGRRIVAERPSGSPRRSTSPGSPGPSRRQQGRCSGFSRCSGPGRRRTGGPGPSTSAPTRRR